jgi:hypothetical protein
MYTAEPVSSAFRDEKPFSSVQIGGHVGFVISINNSVMQYVYGTEWIVPFESSGPAHISKP